MPYRNVIKRYDIDSCYHVYNRGVDKRKIFIDNQDFAIFISLLDRYLGEKPIAGRQGREYEWLADGVELSAFCLMPNHFHLSLYQMTPESITKLLRAINSSYVNYFNQKYGRTGSLFQGIFKAVKIIDDEQLDWLVRYIHRNPINYLSYDWSSLRYWTGERHAPWINVDRFNDMEPDELMQFTCDSSDYHKSLEEISHITIQ